MLIFTRRRESAKVGVRSAGVVCREASSKEKEKEEVGELVSFQEYTRVWIEL